MKQLFVRPLGQFVILSTFVFSQFVFADVVVKDDDNEPSIRPSVMSSTSFYSNMTLSMNDVTVDIVASDLMINFNSPLGIATVSITDINGNIAYQTTVDTDSTSEVIVPIDLLDAGDYTVTVTYGSTVYTEQIQL